jgi:hypothetical protein
MKRKSSLRKRSESDHTVSTGRAPDAYRPIKTEIYSMAAVPQTTHYLTNDEAASFLKLSPRTLEKQRVIGGGPRFRKFGRRVVYAVADLENWANERVCDSTSDAFYLKKR